MLGKCRLTDSCRQRERPRSVAEQGQCLKTVGLGLQAYYLGARQPIVDRVPFAAQKRIEDPQSHCAERNEVDKCSPSRLTAGWDQPCPAIYHTQRKRAHSPRASS